MSYGQKHLVHCECILPQFKNAKLPPRHQFTVFSVVGDDNKVVVKHAQCSNCGVVHKVTDITKSSILSGKESSQQILSIDDIKGSLPENLVNILERSVCDLPTWEYAQFIYENKRWGEFVVMVSEAEEDERVGKYVRIIGENLFKVESFTRKEVANE